MNNPLLYPFLAIVGVLTLAFGVWCYFTIKERRRDAERGRVIAMLQERDEARALVRASMIAAAVAVTLDEVIADDAESAPELPGQPSYGVLYRHHGHRHAPRPKNRADRRRNLPLYAVAYPAPQVLS